ncbi:acetate--CoA ligase family protein, partial [uncultured Legionella sp.]|uniref:ATP-binding protein n=1 Tax=uncultured Legionella sp. TaxID=210934 RepID=UPI00261492BE
MKQTYTPYQYMSTKSVGLSTNYSTNIVPVTVAPNHMVKLLNAPIFFRGYASGHRQPTAFITLLVEQVNSSQLQKVQAAYNSYFKSTLDFFANLNTAESMALAFGKGLCALQEEAGFPIFDSPHLKVSASTTNEFHLYIPMLEEQFLPYLIDVMLKLFNQSVFQIAHLSDNRQIIRKEELINHLKPYAPQGSNSLRFLRAAHIAGIPWMFVEQNIFQLGYGRNSLWLDSSFTDKTSVLATGLAKNKLSTAALLRKAGLPVPKHYFVRSEVEAVNAARKIGYPVVVKPLNEDGGTGVFARLQSEQSVKNAYLNARNYSEQVLVEKHIMGKDYRLQVLHGELIWAIERIPAGIVGDGKRSINALVQELNIQQKNQNPSTAKTIEFTADVIVFLAEQGYNVDSIPKQGQFVAVNTIANISSGGTPIAVNDKVHPDNKRLAETAANLLRLDLAGIDLLLPDIKKSYLEQEGAIIEVNAQPQLGIITAPHIYKDILLKLLPEQGRIPIVGVLGNAIKPGFIEGIQQVLLNQYNTIGLAQSDSAYINGKTVAVTESLFTAGRSLLLNKTVDALIYQVNNLDELSVYGLPFDNLDYLFIGDEFVLERSDHKRIDWLKNLFKACQGL